MYVYIYMASWVAQPVRICLQCKRPWFNSWVGKIPWSRDRPPTPVFLGFPGGSDGKDSTCNREDLDSIPGLGRSPGWEHGNPLQYSCLEDPHGQRSLVGYSPWGCKESDTTDQLNFTSSESFSHKWEQKQLYSAGPPQLGTDNSCPLHTWRPRKTKWVGLIEVRKVCFVIECNV